jgi:hypothetical protein
MGRLAFWANKKDVRIGRGRCLYVGLSLPCSGGKGGYKLPLVSELKVSLCEIYFWDGRGDDVLCWKGKVRQAENLYLCQYSPVKGCSFCRPGQLRTD